MKLIKNILQGKNIAGQILYGIADIMPFPNLLNVYRSVIKDRPYLSKWEVTMEVVGRIDIVRFAVAVVLAYLIVSGKLTTQTATEILALF